jgi:hypothetical protein
VYMMSNSTEEFAKAPNYAILCLLLSCNNCDLHKLAAAASCDILKPIDDAKEMLQSETDVSRTPNCRSQRSTSAFITLLTRRSAIGTKKKKKMQNKMEQAFVWPWKSHKWATFLAISMFAFLLRMLVSLHSYSGICS